MRAVTQSGPGGPETLRVENLPVPKPGAGQVLIRVAWAGVNPHDIGQRKRGAPPPGQTPIFGLECAGEIVAVGDAHEAGRIGQKVAALLKPPCRPGTQGRHAGVPVRKKPSLASAKPIAYSHDRATKEFA